MAVAPPGASRLMWTPLPSSSAAQHLRHRLERRLRRAVGREAAAHHRRVVDRHVDDASATGREHVRHDRAGHQEHPDDVRLDHQPPRLRVRLPERPRVGHEPLVDEPHPPRGVVDEHVDPAVERRALAATSRSTSAATVTSACTASMLPGSASPSAATSSASLGVARHADHDVRAGLRVAQRDRAADAAAATGHDRDAVAQVDAHSVTEYAMPGLARARRQARPRAARDASGAASRARRARSGPPGRPASMRRAISDASRRESVRPSGRGRFDVVAKLVAVHDRRRSRYPFLRKPHSATNRSCATRGASTCKTCQFASGS